MNKKYCFIPTDRACPTCGQEHPIFQVVSLSTRNSNHGKDSMLQVIGPIPTWQHQSFECLSCKKCLGMFFISELVIDLTDNFKAREEIKPKVYKALAEENTFVCESDILALVDEGKKVIKAGTKLYLPIKTFFPERGLNIDSIETFQKKICVTLEPDIDARHYYIPKDSSLKKVESE